MSEIKTEYAEKAKEILTTKGPYQEFHKQNFQNNNFGQMTPINNDILATMPKASIILSEDVYQTLLAVQELTLVDGKEVPFWLYGKEVGDNKIVFDQFFSQSNDRSNSAVSFGNQMINDLTTKVNNNQSDNLVVCRGHSHPQIGEHCENFSLGDLAGDIQFNKDNEVFRSKRVESTSCVIAPSGDINFLYYDNINENFYRFTNVHVQNKDNSYTKINCYKSGQQNTQGIQR